MTNPFLHILSSVLRLPIHLYRYLLAPWWPGHCRFAPSCSTYALDALKLHGPVKGLYLTARRLSRCHPWGGQGFDPVPPPHHPIASEHCSHHG